MNSENATRAEGANHLRVSQKTFDGLLHAGKIPFARVGARKIVIRWSDLVKYQERVTTKI